MGVWDPYFWKWLIPEIAFFPTGGHRRVAWARAMNYGFVLTRWCPFVLFCTTLVSFGAVKLNWFGGVPNLSLILITIAICHFASIILWRRVLQKSLVESLLGLNRCVHCGYDMRGCQSAMCPECGNDSAAESTRRFAD
jgi:hypothetical protein